MNKKSELAMTTGKKQSFKWIDFMNKSNNISAHLRGSITSTTEGERLE
jgi:hypothetical protein